MARRGGRKQISLKIEVEEDTEVIISYLQPEILPVQVMMDVMRERGFKTTSLEEPVRAEIVRLFYKHVSPKFQRDYRDNRRGKILKRMRERKERKVEDSSWKKMVVESKGRSPLLSSCLDDATVGERLKPPPSCIDPSRKTIKLGGPAKVKGASGLDFVIKRHSSEDGKTESDDSAKKMQVDTNGEEKRKNEFPTDTGTKKLKKEDSEDKQPQSVEPSDTLQKRVERKPISWP